MVFRHCGKKLSILVSMLALSCASCSFGPARVKQPGIDASAAGSAAIETYDKNGDGIISGDELEKAPALKAGLTRPWTPTATKALSRRGDHRTNKCVEVDGHGRIVVRF